MNADNGLEALHGGRFQGSDGAGSALEQSSAGGRTDLNTMAVVLQDCG
jgi:hypothetical protein